MGAQLWHHEAPWHSDPLAALKALQARFLRENYDLAALLPQHLDWARESLAATEREGDPYGLLELYQQKVELLERLCGEPLPENAEEQIELVRQISADSGEGVGNVLDVVDVSDERAVWAAERLSEDETVRLAGTAQPTKAQAAQAVETINEELGRGECVCFPIFENGKPAGWYFVGNTID